ncbi:MAG: beta-glucuronidase [Actinomycetota bacterium]|nr:beta-glucuronidase [Actinomycetota bacterium]
MLFPRESATREQKDLNGIWSFKADFDSEGERDRWYDHELSDPILMPVPSSYNDVTQDARLRDHVGDVWYERKFRVPISWRDRRLVVRVGSACHHASVWVNGHHVTQHRGGFLPFDADISLHVAFGVENRLTIKVNNTLDWTTLPPGIVVDVDDFGQPLDYKRQKYFHDFFNYAGIHRPVVLYTTPKKYINDITVRTEIEGSTAFVHYDVQLAVNQEPDRSPNEEQPVNLEVHLFDSSGNEVGACQGVSGVVAVPNPHLWEPGAPYLYSLVTQLVDSRSEVADEYSLPVGVRTVLVNEKGFFINGKPFYFRGFGKHEDADLRGKGSDNVTNIKDFNLLEWMGANSFRTSHYPYADEIMDLADQLGLVVIDEVPAVGLNMWDRNETVFVPERIGDTLLDIHIGQLRELVQRDKNHPCVVMWSVANEPATYEASSRPYFARVARSMRQMDSTRPLTIVEYTLPDESHVADLVDVLCVNRYIGWYSDCGDTSLVEKQLEDDLRRWRSLYGKPILITEYGADAVGGFHQDPPAMFTEEFQCELLSLYHRVFDKLDFVIGEHVWNFADFATKQSPSRVLGNRKGVFTRQRQPKSAAHLLRRRWTQR